MKLWLLLPVENLPYGDNPWEPWYDKAFGFVVRAESEETARVMVMTAAGDEIGPHWAPEKQTMPWLDGKYSTCVELLPDGSEEIIMRDFARA